MILAIDPSNTVHAWALLDPAPAGLRLYASGRDLAADPQPSGLAMRIVCEMVACYGMAAGAHLFDTCVAIGRLDARIGPMEFITRTEVKRIVCGQTNARDPNVRQAIIDRFGGPEAIRKGGALWKVAGDTWAAIAVGLAAMSPEARLYVPAHLRAAGAPETP